MVDELSTVFAKITFTEQELQDVQADIKIVSKGDDAAVILHFISRDEGLKYLRTKEIALLNTKVELQRKENLLIEKQQSDTGKITLAELSSSIGTTLRQNFEQYVSELQPIKQAVQEQLSVTVAASKMPEDRLQELREAVHAGVLPVLDADDLESLLALTSSNNQASFDWDGGYGAREDQRRTEYAQQIQSKTREAMGRPLPLELEWKDARNITVKKQFSALMYAITARNDEVLIVKAFSGAVQDGAILGVELKKQLTRQGLRQAETEYYLWQYSSLYPFCQIITDLNTGGVAYYAHGQASGSVQIFRRAMIGMEKVWDFISSLIKQLDIAALTKALKEDSASAPLPQLLTFPSRVRPNLQSIAVSTADDRSRDELFWRLLSAARQDESDIANLADLVDMYDPQFPPAHTQDVHSHMYA